MGKILVWDFTCPDTLAPSHVNQSASLAGSAATLVDQGKRLKYAELASLISILFSPVSIETLGTWGPFAVDLCREIGSRLAQHSRELRSHQFLVQRLSIAVQRDNAASVAGTQPSQDMSHYPIPPSFSHPLPSFYFLINLTILYSDLIYWFNLIILRNIVKINSK